MTDSYTITAAELRDRMGGLSFLLPQLAGRSGPSSSLPERPAPLRNPRPAVPGIANKEI